MQWHDLVARFIIMLVSWLDAANLRNRVYSQQARIESLELALEDIDRINARSENPNTLITAIVNNTKE